MDLTHLLIGPILLVLVGIPTVYGLLAVRHASRFRHISRRTVTVSLFFILLSTLMLLGIFGAYVFLLTGWNWA